jgi:hypothetical protein
MFDIQRIKRLIWFILSILLGVGAGLAVGWVVQPARYANTHMDSLRSDYMADYVLMVAEAYGTDGDLAAAVNNLETLSTEKPIRTVQQAIITAQQIGYAPEDIELLGRLAQAVQVWFPEAPTEAAP